MWKWLTLGIFLGLVACSSKPKSPTLAMTSFEQDFYRELWQVYPTMAFAYGLSDYAGELPAPDAESRKKQKEFLQKYLERLEQISVAYPAQLISEQMDRELIHNFLQQSLWELDTFKAYQWNPALYNAGSTLNSIFETQKMSGSEKLEALLKKLSQIPAYYKAALAQIQKPTLEHLDLAIRQNSSFADYLNKDFLPRAEELAIHKEQKMDLREKTQSAEQAVKNYVASLKSMRQSLAKNGGFRNFRIGKALYAEKFKYDLQSSYTPEEIYQKALETKKVLHKDMLLQAKVLWPKYFPHKAPPAQKLVMLKMLTDKIAQNHVRPNEFVTAVRKQIPELSSFVEQKQLLTLDPQHPLVVRETPVYERGVAGAGVNAPGPFDAYRETYYDVSPLDGFSPEKQESYLREYNHYTMQILNIHEAIPGHYAQLVYSLKTPSLTQKIFGNGTMIEGWAVYSEKMMMEEGYGNFQPELLFMYSKWRLRVVANTILDYSVHNLDMTRKQAMNLLMNEAFQEKAEAEEKWNRATYSQVQLASYFSGFSEIYDFREELKKKKGSQFSLREFHEKFLSYGSSPIPQIKKRMRKEML